MSAYDATFKAALHVGRESFANSREPALQRLLCQYLYFCASKASKLSTRLTVPTGPLTSSLRGSCKFLLYQYLYFCTSKASKLSTAMYRAAALLIAAYIYIYASVFVLFVPVKQIIQEPLSRVCACASRAKSREQPL
jgi:hypothetical protein